MKQPCPTCDGHGRIQRERRRSGFFARFRAPEKYFAPCSDCAGTGIVQTTDRPQSDARPPDAARETFGRSLGVLNSKLHEATNDRDYDLLAARVLGTQITNLFPMLPAELIDLTLQGTMPDVLKVSNALGSQHPAVQILEEMLGVLTAMKMVHERPGPKSAAPLKEEATLGRLRSPNVPDRAASGAAKDSKQKAKGDDALDNEGTGRHHADKRTKQTHIPTAHEIEVLRAAKHKKRRLAEERHRTNQEWREKEPQPSSPFEPIRGVVTYEHGDAIFGDDDSYKEDAYLGRVWMGDELLLLAEAANENHFGFDVVKVKIVSSRWKDQVGWIGWVRPEYTSFAERFGRQQFVNALVRARESPSTAGAEVSSHANDSVSFTCVHCGRLMVPGRQDSFKCPGCGTLINSRRDVYCGSCDTVGAALMFDVDGTILRLTGKQSLYDRKASRETEVDSVVVCQRCGKSVECSSNLLNPFEVLKWKHAH